MQEALAVFDKYHAHVRTLDLPNDVREIAHAFFVNDALIARLRQSDEPNNLELTLRCGDLQIGYFDLHLSYANPGIEDEDLRRLLLVASNARSDTRYGMTDAWGHEFHVLPDGCLEHTITFHGPGEDPILVTVRCSDVRVELVPRPARRLPPYPHRYRVQRFSASSSAKETGT